MTGDELRAARQAVPMTQQEVADRLGVSWQTVGSWERLGGEDVLTKRPRETVKTKSAKMRLVPWYITMQGLGAIHEAMERLYENKEAIIPAPCEYPFYISKGDPLILTAESALPGDLVVLRDKDGQLSTIGRVKPEMMSGEYVVDVPRQAVRPLPPPGEYMTVEYYLHRVHAGPPDIPVWSDCPADMI